MRIGNPKWENVVFKTRHVFPPGFLNGEHPNTSNSMAFDHFRNILDRTPCNDCEKLTWRLTPRVEPPPGPPVEIDDGFGYNGDPSNGDST